MAALAAAPEARARRRWTLIAVPLAAGLCAQQVQQSFFVFRSASARTGSTLVAQPRWISSKARGPAPLKYDGGLSPEQEADNLKWARKVEAPFLAGQKLWSKLNEMKKAVKIYVIATTGRQGPAVGRSLAECLAYIQPADGTMIHQRKPHIEYPGLEFDFRVSDEEVAKRSRISAVDLFIEDESKYRELETEVIRDFHEKELGGLPAVMALGDSVLEKPENVEMIKQGLLIWVDASLEKCWQETQRSGAPSNSLTVMVDLPRPPVWAIANGWDGDADDSEGKAEYMEIASELRNNYEKYAELRLNGDVPEVNANPLWGTQRLLKAMTEHFGIESQEGGKQEYEENVLEQDLAKFFESARLDKYLPNAKEWSSEQGASSIEEIVENAEELGEALKLKPLEKKRLLKAAASVAESLGV